LPPGPSKLRFVDGDAFMLLGLLVVLANTVTIVVEVLHPNEDENVVFALNTAFMSFYVVEFTLKALLWRGQLLCGSFSRIWWNWLDLVILLSGLVDILPVPDLTLPGGTPLSTVVRPLRLCRLARLVKLVVVMDFSWAESDRCQVFIMGVIVFSSIMMSLEDSYPTLCIWPYLEHTVLLIFAFELLARLKHDKLAYFYNKDCVWNWLDFIIVLGGVTDMWMIPTIAFVRTCMGDAPAANEDAGDMGGLMMLLRMARLLRILRLARLIRRVPSLYKLLQGTREAMQGVMWVLVLVMLLLYALSLVLVNLVRSAADEQGEDGGVPADVLESVASVWEVVFMLFEIMNGHEEPAKPLFAWREEFKFIFAVFVVGSSWGVLSILTAVVSDEMLTATKTFERIADEQADEQSQKVREVRMKEAFLRLDSDGSGQISKHEFHALLDDEEQGQWFCRVAGSGMEKEDICQLTEILDRDNYIEQKEFVRALQEEGTSPRERSMMKLENKMHKLEDDVMQIEQQVRMSRGQVGTISLQLREGGMYARTNSAHRRLNSTP
jgi:Ca2+-binding EF-hand superfamily protein